MFYPHEQQLQDYHRYDVSAAGEPPYIQLPLMMLHVGSKKPLWQYPSVRWGDRSALWGLVEGVDAAMP